MTRLVKGEKNSFLVAINHASDYFIGWNYQPELIIAKKNKFKNLDEKCRAANFIEPSCWFEFDNVFCIFEVKYLIDGYLLREWVVHVFWKFSLLSWKIIQISEKNRREAQSHCDIFCQWAQKRLNGHTNNHLHKKTILAKNLIGDLVRIIQVGSFRELWVWKLKKYEN